MPPPIATTIQEIDTVKRDCLQLLKDLRKFYPLPTATTAYPDIFRLLAVPLLYAAWERCFTLCNAVAWRRLRDESSNPSVLTGPERAAWLMQADFYRSFTKKLTNSATAGREELKPKKSHFPALAEFMNDLDTWSLAPLDTAVEIEKLVMTFSNVNPDVVAQNAEALGITGHPAYQAIKFGRLHSLLELRNGIGHGSTLQAPPNGEFVDLWTFTEELIESYSEMFKMWIVQRFPPPALPPPATLRKHVYSILTRLIGKFLG